MRLFITIGLSAIVFSSPAMASDQAQGTSSAKTTHLMRIESFAKQLSNIVVEIPRQISPMVKAIDGEISAALRSDWPKVRDELRSQIRHLSASKRERRGKQ